MKERKKWTENNTPSPDWGKYLNKKFYVSLHIVMRLLLLLRLD